MRRLHPHDRQGERMSDKELGTPAQNASNSGDHAAEADVTNNSRPSRRRVLQAAGLTAGVVAAAATGLTIGQPEQAAEAAPKGRTGTMADLKHIVIVMQENRS